MRYCSTLSAESLRGAAHKDIHPQQEFLHAEWFGDIIVGSGEKPFDAVFFHRAGGEEEYGDHIAVLADLTWLR